MLLSLCLCYPLSPLKETWLTKTSLQKQFLLEVTVGQSKSRVSDFSCLSAESNYSAVGRKNKSLSHVELQNFIFLVHLLVFWFIEAVCQTALATVVSVKVTSHEDSSSTLLRGALPAQTTDLAILIHLGRAKTHHLRYTLSIF